MGIRSQNNPIAAYLDVFSRSGTDASTGASGAAGSGLTATGGVISDYTEPNNKVYRAHIFTSSDTFTVSDIPGDFGSNVEYLVVAGGGSGGGQGAGAGGGGAGGLRTNLPGVRDAGNNPLTGAAFPVSTTGGDGSGNYSVLIGGGAAAFPGSGYGYHGYKGAQSSFGPIVSEGGGAGGASNEGSVPAPHGAGTGGSGGGRGGRESGSAYAGNTPPTSPPQGNPGGARNGNYYAGGGGGAGAAGSDGVNGTRGGAGGIGVQVTIAGPAADTTGVGAINPGPGQGQWFAGGGAGGSYPDNPIRQTGGAGGGGDSGHAPSANGLNATVSTGGGGGGAAGNGPMGGNGASGIVVVRYQKGAAASAKATGGAISFYNGNTIHAFTSSGTFTVTSPIPGGVTYLVVAGGGGGAGHGGGGGGGGGAGGYLTGTGHPVPVAAYPIVIGAGGAGGQMFYGNDGRNNTPGLDTTFSSFRAAGGGKGGGVTYPATHAGDVGGSGGGGAARSSPDPNYAGKAGNQYGPQSPANPGPAPGQGNSGGNGYASGNNTSGGGGGGAGSAGSSAGASDIAHGGAGLQAPTVFRDPNSSVGAPGPGGGKYWFAGGGGGGSQDPAGGDGGGPGGPYAGGGDGKSSTDNAPGDNGIENTGGGGGGPGGSGSNYGGSGGSGIVLIAYST